MREISDLCNDFAKVLTFTNNKSNMRNFEIKLLEKYYYLGCGKNNDPAAPSAQIIKLLSSSCKLIQT